MNLKPVESKEKLIELFYFFSKLFYDEAKRNDEKYNVMTKRYEEMEIQFVKDPSLLLYIEKDNKIVAGVTIKNHRGENATIGLLAVSKEFRGEGIGELLVNEIEKVALSKGIKLLNLGARPTANGFYEKLGYSSSLMIQVFDFETVEHVLEVNTKYKNYSVIRTHKDIAYGYVFFKTDKVDLKVLEHFENKLEACNVIYVFNKKLED